MKSSFKYPVNPLAFEINDSQLNVSYSGLVSEQDITNSWLNLPLINKKPYVHPLIDWRPQIIAGQVDFEKAGIKETDNKLQALIDYMNDDNLYTLLLGELKLQITLTGKNWKRYLSSYPNVKIKQ